MTLQETIQKELSAAIKARENDTINTLRLVKAEITKESTQGKLHELTDADVIKIIQRLAKQRKESIEIYASSGRKDLEEIERRELEVLERFLPKMLSDAELEEEIGKMIAEIGANSVSDMGRIMAQLSTRFAGRYDGKNASGIVRRLLS